MTRYQRRSEALGMPFGTAKARLMKAILLKVLTDNGLNLCYRCQSPISSERELSIEHKVAWESKNADVFWDLDNIAFSHVLCNSLGSAAEQRKPCPEGFSWCHDCKQFLQIEKFSKYTRRLCGLQTKCRDCKTKREKVRRERLKSAA